MTVSELVRARRVQLERKAGRVLADKAWAQVERRVVLSIEERIARVQDIGSTPITIEADTVTVSFRLELLPLIQ
ncbi:MAG: hypothetical protein ACHQ0J_01335 [Candidatus Dormibacterales bacterium]